jgi:hypothetical protein
VLPGHRGPSAFFSRTNERDPIAPSPDAILPLLTAEQFRNSLLILASAAPLDLSAHAVSPAVRVLLLSPALAPDGGALRLVRLLVWAARVARKWRAAGGGGAGSVAELAHEDDDGADELLPAPPRLFGLRSSRSIPNSPTASYASLAQGAPGTRPRSLSSRLFTRPSIVPAPSAG